MVTWGRSCHKEYTYAIWKPDLFWFESYGQGYSFSKVGQTSSSRSQNQKLWCHVKGLVIRDKHVQYESPITSGLKVMTKVKFFKSRSLFKVKVIRANTMVQCERSCHKEYTCAIWKSYPSGKKVMANVKVFVHASHADMDSDANAVLWH